MALFNVPIQRALPSETHIALPALKHLFARVRMQVFLQAIWRSKCLPRDRVQLVRYLDGSV